MNRKFLRIISVLLLALVCSCAPDEEAAETPRLVLASSAAGDDPEPAPIAKGDTLEGEVEPRGAVLLSMRGIVKNDAKPYEVELLKSIEADIYTDLDAAEGPAHWLTIAKLVDGDGQVLWKRHVNSLFQLIEYLTVVMRETGVINLKPQQIWNFVNGLYPQLLEFAVQIPANVEGAEEFVMEIPLEDGEMTELGRFDYAELVANAEPPSEEGEVIPLIETGSAEDRIDIVILGDGYTEALRSKFELDARAIAERLVETPPFKEHADYFNIRAVWTPSNETGAGYDCSGHPIYDRGCKNELRDTVFEMVFIVTALADQYGLQFADSAGRVAMPLQITKMYELAALAQADEIILVSNTKRRSGFAGLYVSVLTAFDARVDFPDVAVHELGHSFGVLGDEYIVEGDPCLYNEPRVPLPSNIAENITLEDIKWSPWLEDMTPLPTPDADKEDVEVGAYSGAYNCPELYRPSHNCKMRNSSREFCSVCSEQLVRRIYSVVDPSPNTPSSVTREDDATLKFKVPMHENPDTFEVTWTLDGEELASGNEVTLEAGEVGGEWSTLEATVTENSGFVARRGEPEFVKTFRWRVRAE